MQCVYEAESTRKRDKIFECSYSMANTYIYGSIGLSDDGLSLVCEPANIRVNPTRETGGAGHSHRHDVCAHLCLKRDLIRCS